MFNQTCICLGEEQENGSLAAASLDCDNCFNIKRGNMDECDQETIYNNARYTVTLFLVTHKVRMDLSDP